MKDLKHLLRQYALLLVMALPLIVIATGCSDDESDPVTPPAVNESELLVQELEGANGNYLNVACPAITGADAVYEDAYGAQEMYLIDIRSASDFSTGHVKGAHNVAFTDVLSHVSSLPKDKKIVIICYSGQTAAFTTALLRMSGYTNASSMKFGMSSWNSAFDRITSKCSSSYDGIFTKDATAKGPMNDMPAINTGKTTGAAILEARVAEVYANGFSPYTVAAKDVIENPNNYYVVNYWGDADYSGIGHIPGAMQYTPKADLASDTYLKTLPTDKIIAVYCYTGQTSANVAAILAVMGYDAKTVTYGTQSMIWQTMHDAGKTAWDASSTSYCHEYPYEQ
jgi:rhodanese-related sulfurtransferase